MTLRRIHRLNALALGVFITAHLFNHMFALSGPDQHIAVMDELRSVYRLLPVEAAIIGLFSAQILIGVLLVLKRGKPDGRWAWAQVVSGGIIAFFLLQHLGAVLFMRLTSDLDTNFYWAASVVSLDPIRWYFIPYYWLGVAAIFVHIAAALHFRQIGSQKLQVGIGIFGAVFAAMIVTAFSGGLYDFDLPQANEAYLIEMYEI